MQMKSISKVKFGQLNDKRFYFSNDITSLPYGNPSLEKVRQQKNKYPHIHKVIQTKKDEFLKEETKVIEKKSKIRHFKSNLQSSTANLRIKIRNKLFYF